MPLLALLAGLAMAPVDTARIVLVATTDMHGEVTDWDYLRNTPLAGGLARAAAVIDSLRERYPGQVVVVDAGDAFAGSPFSAYFGRQDAREPYPVIDAMNLVGYDAATPGDHDFDFGAALFNRALAAANFPWVSGNIKALPADTLALAPFVVVQRNGVKLAITGFTTPGTMVWNGAQLRSRYRIDRIEPELGKVVGAMRENADLVIVLCHSGFGGLPGYDSTGVGAENVAAALATGGSRPDIVVVGHTHQEIVDSVIAGVHFVQPRAQAGSVAILHLALVPKDGRLTPVRIRAERVPLAEVRPSARLLRRLSEPHAAVLRWVTTGVGESQGRFSLATARVEDVPLMRFIHEVQRRATGADLSAATVLDLRAGLEPGEITLGELFRLAPSEYPLRAVRITGDQLKAYLEQSARYFFVDSTARVFTNRYAPADRYDVLGGASYVIDLSQPMGSRITALTVRGRAVQASDSFTLAIAANRHQGQGGFAMLARAPIVADKGVTLRDALIAEVKRRRTIRPDQFDGHDWSLTPTYLARRARGLFVRETAAAAGGDPEPDPASGLNLGRTRAEQQAEDSIERERERAAAAAGVVVATLRLPAETGPGGGLGRLLADAYRNALRADVGIALTDEGTTRLPARGLTASEIEAAAMGEATLLGIPMSGADLSELLENAFARAAPCCEFSGLQVEYDPSAKPWERVRRVRLGATGKSIDRKRTYLVAISSRLVQGDGFSLGSTDCRPVQGCRTPGQLSRWQVEQTTRRPAEVLREYLRHLPQPVTPPEDRRVVSTR
jgi:2',3'-cyclic-nucleotide 2'-phosphodiesterase/3'-nucleotidase